MPHHTAYLIHSNGSRIVPYPWPAMHCNHHVWSHLTLELDPPAIYGWIKQQFYRWISYHAKFIYSSYFVHLFKRHQRWEYVFQLPSLKIYWLKLRSWLHFTTVCCPICSLILASNIMSRWSSQSLAGMTMCQDSNIIYKGLFYQKVYLRLENGYLMISHGFLWDVITHPYPNFNAI